MVTGEFDIIIIGANLTGLVCAALLSNEGYKVLVLEKNSVVGGRIVSKREHSDAILDNGIYLCKTQNSTLNYVLNTLDESINFYPISNIKIFYNENNSFPLTDNIFSILFSSIFNFKDKIKLINILNKLKKLENVPNINLKEWLLTFTPSNEVLEFFNLLCLILLNIELSEAVLLEDFLLNFNKLFKQKDILGYPEGGWQAIFEKLIYKIRSNKSEILTNCNVEGLIIGSNNVLGVKVHGRDWLDIQARVYICAVGLNDLKDIINLNYLTKQEMDLINSIHVSKGIIYNAIFASPITDIKDLLIFRDPLSIGIFLSNLEKNLTLKDKQIFTSFLPNTNSINKLKIKLLKIFPKWSLYKEWEQEYVLDITNTTKVIPKKVFKFQKIDNLFFCGPIIKRQFIDIEHYLLASLECVKLVSDIIKSL